MVVVVEVLMRRLLALALPSSPLPTLSLPSPFRPQPCTLASGYRVSCIYLSPSVTHVYVCTGCIPSAMYTMDCRGTSQVTEAVTCCAPACSVESTPFELTSPSTTHVSVSLLLCTFAVVDTAHCAGREGHLQCQADDNRGCA